MILLKFSLCTVKSVYNGKESKLYGVEKSVKKLQKVQKSALFNTNKKLNNSKSALAKGLKNIKNS